MSGIQEEEKRLKFGDLQKALATAGWTDWTVIAFNPDVEEYKIFSHLSDEINSLQMLQFIIEKMLEKLIEANRIHSAEGGSC